METLILLFVNLLGIYMAIGLLFALVFLFTGLPHVDPSTKDTSIWFKLLLLPGMSALWPLFALKWLKTKKA